MAEAEKTSTPIVAKVAALTHRLTPSVPVSAKSAEPKPDAPAVAKSTAAPAEETKAKRGRPPGAKSKPKVVAAPPAAAKAATPKPVASKITTPSIAPRKATMQSEGSKTMNDTITTMQDTAKKFTGEANARAKGAYDRTVKLGEEFAEFQKGNVEAIVESSKLAAKAAETIGQHAADYARKSFEQGTAVFKGFAAAKSPTELFKLQSDYMKSHFDSVVAESSKLTEAWLKAAGEVVQPLSNRVAIAVDKAKVATAL